MAEGKKNIMTIGWASMGIMWGRPNLSVMIRNSRYTYDLIEKSSEFTVSIPTGDMVDALKICGTMSGRSVDKCEKTGLEFTAAQKVATPIIDCAGIHLECRIVCKTPIDPANLYQDYHKLYPNHDYHTIYFGEILHCYES